MWNVDHNGVPQISCGRCYGRVFLDSGLIIWTPGVSDSVQRMVTSAVHPKCFEEIKANYPKMVSMPLYEYIEGLIDADEAPRPPVRGRP